MEKIRFIESPIEAGVAEITPELAKEIPETLNERNRPLKKAYVKMLTSSLKNDEWMLNGESIAFSESGKLLAIASLVSQYIHRFFRQNMKL